jgi:acyl-coenzyme A thioesterase PaaI-like protein
MAHDDGRRDGNYPFWAGPGLEVTGVWAERRRLARAMRAIIDRLPTNDAPEDELREAADHLEQLAARLADDPRRTRPMGVSETATAGDVAALSDFSPLIGLSNPLSPPITITFDGATVRATVRFGAAYEGPPAHVHGGLIAAAFDEVLGCVQWTTGSPGFTGTLTIRYRRPAPVNAELRFEATVQRVEGRKIFAEGRMYVDGDVLAAEAEGIFISVDSTKMAALMEDQRRRQEES